MTWQLIVHDDSLVAEEATKAVKAAIGERAQVFPVNNLERARALLDSSDLTWSLVVVGANTPTGAYSSRGASTSGPARSFIRDLKARDGKLPVIALAPTSDLELAGLLSAYEDSAALVDFGPNWRDTLATRARELHMSARPEGSALELEITLEGNCSGRWRLVRRGRISCSADGPIVINCTLFDELLESCRALAQQTGRADAWLSPFNTVASKLKRLLFTGCQQNEDLWLTFVDQRAKVGGTKNTRFFFTMSSNTQPMIVEALKDNDPNFWMLQAPIVRQYNYAGEKNPLFKDPASLRGPIDCLIIDADPARGRINDDNWQGELDPLEASGLEAEAIVSMLEAARPLGIGRVERLPLSEYKDDPIRAVQDRLDKGPWHLVHFVGHGVTSKWGTAGLVLQAVPGGVLPFSALTPKLRSAQFLFVSSCRSADSSFLTSAIQNVVPAILGYRWPVLDHGALQFARSFYEALFKQGESSFKSLEYAFLAARKAAFNLHPEQATWASPMLITQLRQTQ